MSVEFSRRALLRGGGAVGLAALIPAEILSACGSNPPASPFDHRQMALLTEATARLIPGPEDDPVEAGHPGAREAGAAEYIATLVGALSFTPPRVYTGGPFSDRAGSTVDGMARFVPLSPVTGDAWRTRLLAVRDSYVLGLAELDRRAKQTGSAGFLSLEAEGKDRILATNFKLAALPREFSGFTDMMFSHAIEGTYAAPEYGGNRRLVGWADIGYPGDVQPRGYTPAQVSAPLNRVALVPGPAVQALLDVLKVTSPPPLEAP